MPNRIPGRLKRRLVRIVGENSLLDHAAGLAVYGYDSSLQTGCPDLALFPQNGQQVAEIVHLLHSEKIPYVARGAGTNLSGGSVPLHGGIVIVLSRMREILEINPAGCYARVQPGVANLELQEALKKYGFFFAPDPASQRVSTIGGNVAENSGGPHCLKYGVTTNHILGVKVVAPDGRIIELGGTHWYSPGMDLLGLFIGSEGTLGIAAEITCRILPLPRAVRTMLAVYDSTEDAGRTVSDIIAAGILPATLEMMDNLVIRAVEESLHAGYPTDADAVLIIEVDGMGDALGEVVGEIEAICRRNHVRNVRTAANEKERDALWAGRRGAFGAVARLFPNYSVSDGTVPRTKLPQVLRQVSEIGKRYGLSIGNVFHAGDGNLHPLIFFDARDREQIERAHQASGEILAACAEAGGTISGEHGIGGEKIKAMPLVFGSSEIELMRKLKQAIDPACLCNPGKILPEEDLSSRENSVAAAEHEEIQPAGGLLGVPLYAPKNAGELSSVIASLRGGRKSFAAIGGDTLFGDLPRERLPDALILTSMLRSIIEYDAPNLTVTAEAGLTLRQLQDALRNEKQFLPLDAPPQATLGGIVATGLPGPRRHLYGAPRDLALGLKFADASGRILKAGGKTVKNVAGYDFGKLLIGSWGTLGVITEITFRLLPLPKKTSFAVAGFRSLEDACGAGAQILTAGVNPSLLVLLNQKASSVLAETTGHSFPNGPYALLLGAEGFELDVGRQMTEMMDVCKRTSQSVSDIFAEEAYAEALAAVTNFGYPFFCPDACLSVCLSYQLEETRTINEAFRQIETDFPVESFITSHIASGVLFAHFLRNAEGATLLDRLKDQFPRMHGVALGSRSRDEDADDVPLLINHGRASEGWRKSIKECFDPDNLLCPGLIV